MKKRIEKIISLVFTILIITLTPITTYINIENNVYATDIVATDKLYKQSMIALLVSAGLVFNTTQEAEDVYQKLNDYWVANNIHLKYWQQGPEDPVPDFKTIILGSILGSMVYDRVSGCFKWIGKISNELFQDVKKFVDDNYNEGNNTVELVGQMNGVTYQVKFQGENTWSIQVIMSLNGSEEKSYTGMNSGYTDRLATVEHFKITNIIDVDSSYKKVFFDYQYKVTKPDGSFYYTPTTIATSSVNVLYGTNTTLPETNNLYGTPGIVDNPTYDWTNTTTNQREIVIPIAPNEVGLPKKDETGIYVPNIDTEDWIGVTPAEIPNMDPKGEPFLEPGQLPEVPANPQTIPEKILYFVAEAFKKISGIKQNTDISNPTIMGLPSADGTGNGGTGTQTKFDWGDFSKFFDIFFIFIYFIVMLILILLKLLQVVFSNLPNIPANTELFDNYPTILDGVNYIKNLKVGGLSITVQQAFEYVFLIFFFIFILKQLRKLYGAYVYEENERSRTDSGLSDTNFERKHYDYYSDARKNPNKYSNIKVSDLRGKNK